MAYVFDVDSPRDGCGHNSFQTSVIRDGSICVATSSHPGQRICVQCDYRALARSDHQCHCRSWVENLTSIKSTIDLVSDTSPRRHQQHWVSQGFSPHEFMMFINTLAFDGFWMLLVPLSSSSFLPLSSKNLCFCRWPPSELARTRQEWFGNKEAFTEYVRSRLGQAVMSGFSANTIPIQYQLLVITSEPWMVPCW